jgi:hypothetical protein
MSADVGRCGTGRLDVNFNGYDADVLGMAFFAMANLVCTGGFAGAALWWYRIARNASSGWSGPERMLAERFARGEIDDTEYRSRLETLRTASGGPTANGQQRGSTA